MHKSGFTLIEIAIAMVVIGLIISAVIIGANIIEHTKINRLIAQVEEYHIKTSTFKEKYLSYPGDLRSAYTVLGSNCGTASTVTDSNTGMIGNGDAIVDWESGSTRETRITMCHLTEAGFTGDDSFVRAGTHSSNQYRIGESVAPTEYRDDVGLVITGKEDSSTGGPDYYNYNIWVGRENYGNAVDALDPLTSAFTTKTAHKIDVKLDDGVPNAGYVRPTDSVDDPTRPIKVRSSWAHKDERGRRAAHVSHCPH